MLFDQYASFYFHFFVLFFLLTVLFYAYQALILFDHNKVFCSQNIFSDLFC